MDQKLHRRVSGPSAVSEEKLTYSRGHFLCSEVKLQLVIPLKLIQHFIISNQLKGLVSRPDLEDPLCTAVTASGSSGSVSSNKNQENRPHEDVFNYEH